MTFDDNGDRYTEALKMKLLLGVVTSDEIEQLVSEAVRKKALRESTSKKSATDKKED